MSNAILFKTEFNKGLIFKITVEQGSVHEGVTYQVKKDYYAKASSIIKSNNLILARSTIFETHAGDTIKLLINSIDQICIIEDRSDLHIELTVEMIE
ncbi:hypothetical protein N7548_00140 [Acholeplasma manati]|uniref:Uncharacterized protein n=1 Tax=Paracholeplasma manati TaxID=591373 RepID=A0ABT2Y3B8_9MOLU|nr:hypothetical protein [Paracholeplasma manati]MCV2231234.1 hypothetical protein [Paracholeplasma manati]